MVGGGEAPPGSASAVGRRAAPLSLAWRAARFMAARPIWLCACAVALLWALLASLAPVPVAGAMFAWVGADVAPLNGAGSGEVRLVAPGDTRIAVGSRPPASSAGFDAWLPLPPELGEPLELEIVHRSAGDGNAWWVAQRGSGPPDGVYPLGEPGLEPPVWTLPLAPEGLVDGLSRGPQRARSLYAPDAIRKQVVRLAKGESLDVRYSVAVPLPLTSADSNWLESQAQKSTPPTSFLFGDHLDGEWEPVPDGVGFDRWTEVFDTPGGIDAQWNAAAVPPSVPAPSREEEIWVAILLSVGGADAEDEPYRLRLLLYRHLGTQAVVDFEDFGPSDLTPDGFNLGPYLAVRFNERLEPVLADLGRPDKLPVWVEGARGKGRTVTVGLAEVGMPILIEDVNGIGYRVEAEQVAQDAVRVRATYVHNHRPRAKGKSAFPFLWSQRYTDYVAAESIGHSYDFEGREGPVFTIENAWFGDSAADEASTFSLKTAPTGAGVKLGSDCQDAVEAGTSEHLGRAYDIEIDETERRMQGGGDYTVCFGGNRFEVVQPRRPALAGNLNLFVLVLFGASLLSTVVLGGWRGRRTRLAELSAFVLLQLMAAGLMGLGFHMLLRLGASPSLLASTTMLRSQALAGFLGFFSVGIVARLVWWRLAGRSHSNRFHGLPRDHWGIT